MNIWKQELLHLLLHVATTTSARGGRCNSLALFLLCPLYCCRNFCWWIANANVHRLRSFCLPRDVASFFLTDYFYQKWLKWTFSLTTSFGCNFALPQSCHLANEITFSIFTWLSKKKLAISSKLKEGMLNFLMGQNRQLLLTHLLHQQNWCHCLRCYLTFSRNKCANFVDAKTGVQQIER